MIDFHSHILPGIDDGSRSIEETKNLLLEAKNIGITKIISTSHYAIDCFETPEYKREELIKQLNSENKYPEIILGSEIFLTYNIIDLLKEYKASPINKTNYILFELPLKEQFLNLKDLINKLKENNYKLILAHPERYYVIQKNFNYLLELKEMGIIFQSNYASILGYYGLNAKLILKKMLKNNLVSLLGSDVHRENTIYPRIPRAIKKIKSIITEEYFKDISENNALKILNNENIF